MSVLFCHDGPISMDELGEYYGVAHNDNTFSRYYNLSNDLKVMMRVKKINANEISNYSKITVKPFSVIETPNISNIKGSIFGRKKYKNIIEKNVKKSDVVVARLPSMCGFYAIDFAKKYNIPYIIELVTCPWDMSWNHSFKGKIAAFPLFLKTRNRVRNANKVIYVTSHFLQNRYPTRGESTNCSNVHIENPPEFVLEDRLKKIESMPNKFIMGTVAALDVKFKGQQYVIRSMYELKKQNMLNFEYHLVGGGNSNYLRSEIEKYKLEEHVKIIGPMKHSQIDNFLQSIDLYIQPSKQEGLPRAVIEAMSQGLPCLGANTAGIPELLEDNCIFDKKNNISRNISNVIKSMTKEKMIHQAKRNFIEAKKYNKEIINDRRIKFFEDVKIGMQNG